LDVNIQSIELKEMVNNKETVIDFKEVNQSDFDYVYRYNVPVVDDNYILLEFIVTDIKGRSNSVLKKIELKENVLEEKQGFRMYSRLSDKDYSFSFNEIHVITPSENDRLCDFMDTSVASEEDTNNTSLSLKWESTNQKVEMLKFEGFDYVNATREKIIGAFTNGKSSNFVDEIKISDIILMKYEFKKNEYHYYAIMITAIEDNKDIENDLYVFNIKGINIKK